jgi:hypothetical protein
VHQQYLLVEPQVVQHGATANTDCVRLRVSLTLMCRRFLLGASSSWDVHRVPDRSDTAIVGRGRNGFGFGCEPTSIVRHLHCIQARGPGTVPFMTRVARAAVEL